MISPVTCICLLLAGGSGLYLYTAKHDAQMLDREITKLTKQAQESRSRAALMRAEYDLLGDPERLRELAGQVLSLQPTDPKQYSALADLDRRLPAVAPPPELPQADTTIATADKPAERAIVERALVERPMPERLAERAMPDKPVAEKTVAEKPGAEKPTQSAAPVPPRPTPPPRPAQVAIAAPMPAPMPVPTPAPVAAAPAPIVLHPSLLASAQAAPMPRPTPPRAPAAPASGAAEQRPPTQQAAYVAPRLAPALAADPLARPARNTTVDAPAPMQMPMPVSSLGMARTLSGPGSPSPYPPSSLGLARR